MLVKTFVSTRVYIPKIFHYRRIFEAFFQFNSKLTTVMRCVKMAKDKTRYKYGDVIIRKEKASIMSINWKR
ncbi:uncharacterised protein [Saccharolobus solfataricus]|uniref:Uncharacterized protein n=1 Tax=Saccharolobus solfataricus TaxID=2287 RepID=A0A0E3MJ86_SACSO|nr:uncharacterised protein [Saccharolobus solfataricus]